MGALEISGRRVVVMGLGRFGGGIAVARWLLREGADVLVTDLASREDLVEELMLLGDHPSLSLAMGGHDVADFASADIVVANPAVPRPWENPYLQAAWKQGATVTSEIVLAAHMLDRANVIGVTGSAGKSTTAAMIHAALRVSGVQSHLGGNIGGSVLSSIEDVGQGDMIVLELSSAMLWWLAGERGINWSPRIAVQLDVRPNHLDWHGTLDHYVACKELIVAHQVEGDVAITTATVAAGEIEVSVPGAHNRMNAHVALAAALAGGADEDGARAGIAAFTGLPHRLEVIVSAGACRYVNDSKSTTPPSTALAVASMEDPSSVHLIVGGYDKQLDLSTIAALAPFLGGFYTIGATGDPLAAAAGDRKNVYACGTLDAAVACAHQHMDDGDTLLLSPGCASWDQFRNFEERGDVFRALVSAVSCADELRD